MAKHLDIPMDIYESNNELVIVVPLAWVEKDSLEMAIDDYKLILKWSRNQPKLKDDIMSVRSECYWWDFEQVINLPTGIYFDKIHSKLTPDNILIIIVPKIIVPEKIRVEIELK